MVMNKHLPNLSPLEPKTAGFIGFGDNPPNLSPKVGAVPDLSRYTARFVTISGPIRHWNTPDLSPDSAQYVTDRATTSCTS